MSVFKVIGNQALVIDPPRETVPVATQLRGRYTLARWTGELGVLSPLKLLHFAWGRTAAEVKQKVENWSHARQIDGAAFMRLWESVTLENYQGFRDFHPLAGQGVLWPGLKVVRVEGVERV